MKPITIFAGVLCAAVLAVSQAAPAFSGGPASASSGSPASVSISHFKFHPGTLRIRRGARVVFSNASAIPHTATRRGSFDTGPIKPGSSVTVRFTHRGTFSYICKIHPYMHGTIVVH